MPLSGGTNPFYDRPEPFFEPDICLAADSEFDLALEDPIEHALFGLRVIVMDLFEQLTHPVVGIRFRNDDRKTAPVRNSVLAVELQIFKKLSAFARESNHGTPRELEKKVVGHSAKQLTVSRSAPPVTK